MKSFEVNGKSYDSMSDFCKRTGIPYHKMRRLCRIYRRANKDPAVAAEWLLGLKPLNKAKEAKTETFIRDKSLSRIRQGEYLARIKARNQRRILKIMVAKNG